jgi:hypothetical protein
MKQKFRFEMLNSLSAMFPDYKNTTSFLVRNFDELVFQIENLCTIYPLDIFETSDGKFRFRKHNGLYSIKRSTKKECVKDLFGYTRFLKNVANSASLRKEYDRQIDKMKMEGEKK